MGIFNALRDLFGPTEVPAYTAPRSTARSKKARRGMRRCQVEELESRRLMSATPNNPHVVLGSVYYEEDSGNDNQPDTIDVTFKGGAPGTTLDTLTINGDKRLDGLTDGDIFFDTAPGGLGAYQSQPLQIVSHDGFTVTSATVSDGGTLITFHFSGFKAGDKLRFTVDADEAQYVDQSGVDTNSIVEGGEFQRSIMTGQFSADGFVDLTLQGLFWDEFDPNFAATASSTGVTLDLPNDQYDATHDYTDRTAGAIADAAQIPLATISGWVYHDQDNNGIFDHDNEHAIGGVTLELLDANGNGTGITTTTSTDPATLGFYEFRNLTPGKYGVREVQPAGWLDGKDTAGDHGGFADPETSGRVDKITGAMLDYGDHGLNYNFGELLPGSISGLVEAHFDADCNFDEPPEVTLQGVQIDLLDANGNFLRSTLTDANGQYTFDNLFPGIYQVFEHQPADYYEGMEQVGTAGGTLIAQDHIVDIHIGSDVHGLNYDFCEHIGVMLAGNVYHDRDDDGNFDKPGEEGIGGVLLKLIDGNGHDTGLRATTLPDGSYKFNNLAAGTYSVVEVQPAGWLDGKDTPGNSGGVADVSPPGDRISQITLNWGVNGIEYNFGELLPGSIAGQVVICDDDITGGENIPIPNVQVDLLDSTGKVIDSKITDNQGNYLFTGLRPGQYSVHEHEAVGYFDDEAHIGSGDGVIVDPNDVTGIHVGSDQRLIDYDFCELPPGSISGRVHADTGPDCDFDNPDILLQGVVMDLLDGDGTLIKSTTTDVNGEYHFTDLAPGTYQVREHQPTEYYDGGERVGTVGGNSFDQLPQFSFIAGINLPAGVDATQYDFCEKTPVMLAGNVYHDRSNDGIFDRPGEEGIGGVLLKLLDGNGNDTGKRATTDANGAYKFTGLAAGKYSIMEIQPAGWLDGIDTPGNLGGVAAVSPPGDMLSMIMINWGDSGIEYNFGELLPGSIAGRVVDCANDTVIANVQVDLLDGQGHVVATTHTNQNGAYIFTDLRPGSYSVHEHQPVGYFDHDAYLGSGDGTVADPNDFVGVDVGSGKNLTDYVFCDLPPAQLSGYVFVDGGLIVSPEPPTPDEIAAIRDGKRTSDDTPLAGVTLELRDGTTGAPILIGEALPGTYAGNTSDPIRVVTDANGHYHFDGLPAGLYAVTEVQPDGVLDSMDTPGTTGGFAANIIQPPGVPIPSLSDLVVVVQFQLQYGTDALVEIPLDYGQHSQENNFSEVIWQPPPPIKPPQPPVTPPPPPEPPKPPVLAPPGLVFLPKIYAFPRPNPTLPPDNGFTGDVVDYTWHLSVINAGWPRNVTPAEVKYQLTSSEMDVASWQSLPMDQARWQLGLLEGDKVSIVRDALFGTSNSIPITGDFNGDGITDIAVYIDGQWFVDLNGDGKWDSGDLWAQLGTENDLPVTGDWDADGKTDIGIYGPAWSRDPWAISREPGLPDADNSPTRPLHMMKNMPPTAEDATSGARILKRTAKGPKRSDLIDHVFHYGETSDTPVTGDWNGDGVRQIGVFHDGEWIIDSDGDGRLTDKDEHFTFGQAGDIPVVGDFTGEGVDQVGVFRAGKWILDTNHNHRIDAQDRVFELGAAGDKPVVGDWNDDGIADPGVFTPGQAKLQPIAQPTVAPRKAG